MRLRDLSQEIVELGPHGALFRATWEARTRLRASMTPPPPSSPEQGPDDALPHWTSRLSLPDPPTVADAMRGRVAAADITRLTAVAEDALEGRIRCFDRWTADYGQPIDWTLDPKTGTHWPLEGHPARAMRAGRGNSDIKHTWEAARFPHAYYLARAAAFVPERRAAYATGLTAQISDFAARNPDGSGVHWASGQEIALRLVAWLFAVDALLVRSADGDQATRAIGAGLAAGGARIEADLAYAKFAVPNNHLLSEGLGLLAAGVFAPGSRALRWRSEGLGILAAEADRQFYRDGAYINQSHNYHRAALLTLLWGGVFARAAGLRVPASCTRAMERSLTFLLAHQNPLDGRLPNYGANDGSLPGILSTCDFSDFRPLLQTLSVAVRGERLYEPGPWDEMPAWLVGTQALDLPMRAPARTSVSFAPTGYHVLRGRDASSFATFRCGTLRDRFSQIDMLHLDVWWRGQNVLVDGGTYQYNGAPAWHEHFMRTASHNTLVIDGRDQMLHHRQFKVLYRTKAVRLAFTDDDAFAFCRGEHYGYRRHAGACVHRRDVLFVKDGTWIVVDRVGGSGRHSFRLHWLGGAFEWSAAPAGNGMDLRTPAGVFSVTSYDRSGAPLTGTVVAGDEQTPRGWLSRYYGEKVAVPSFAAERTGHAPAVLVSILSDGAATPVVTGSSWRVETAAASIAFELSDDGMASHAVVPK